MKVAFLAQISGDLAAIDAFWFTHLYLPDAGAE
jgi:hypothetical protein